MGEPITEKEFKRRYLWQTGPYVYYYNENGENENKIIVQNMREIRALYRKIRVFEIKYIPENSQTDSENRDFLKQVFIHYYGDIYKENGLEKQGILRLFDKCINFYNSKLEILAENIGKKGRRKSADKITETKEAENLRIKSRKKCILSRKISNPSNTEDESILNPHNILFLQNKFPPNFINFQHAIYDYNIDRLRYAQNNTFDDLLKQNENRKQEIFHHRRKYPYPILPLYNPIYINNFDPIYFTDNSSSNSKNKSNKKDEIKEIIRKNIKYRCERVKNRFTEIDPKIKTNIDAENAQHRILPNLQRPSVIVQNFAFQKTEYKK